LKRFIHPELVAQLSKLELKAKLVVEGFMAGLHKSPYHGANVEFAEHRQYYPGDDIRYIDWKAYGRFEKYYIKEYEEETNLKCYILLDKSASMDYRSTGLSKLEYTTYLAASLAYLMLKQQDYVSLVTFGAEIEKYIPPRGTLNHLHILFEELSRLKASGDTRMSKVFHELAEKIKRRGLIIVISDLLDDPEEVIGGLKHFRHKKHEVILFHVLDEYEISFPFRGPTLFKGLEGGELQADPQLIRDEYISNIRRFLQEYKRKCGEAKIDYALLNTNTPFGYALLSYLTKRRKFG
jgi:uncharacterized protein (DUF58 family)